MPSAERQVTEKETPADSAVGSMGPISFTAPVATAEQKRRNYALLCAIWCGAGGGVLDFMLLQWGAFERYLLNFAAPTNAAPVDIWVIVAVAVWTIGTGLVAVFIGGIVGWFIGRRLAATSVALFVLAALPLAVLGLGFVCSVFGGRLTTLEYFEFGTIAAMWVGIPFLLRAKAVIGRLDDSKHSIIWRHPGSSPTSSRPERT